jgi:hypothetical protein
LAVPLLVHLCGELAQDALGLGLVGGRAPDPQLSPGQRVVASEDDHLVRATALADHSAGREAPDVAIRAKYPVPSPVPLIKI